LNLTTPLDATVGVTDPMGGEWGGVLQMADNQFKNQSDDVWERENRWSMWTIGEDLHTTHEKRVPYIIDTEKCHGVSEHGISAPDSARGSGSVAPEIRGASEGASGAPKDGQDEKADGGHGGTCW
jgi:hypothetical protein